MVVVRSQILFDVDQASLHERADDVARLEERESAFAGQLGQRALTVDLAQQRPGVGVERDVGLAPPRRQHGDGVGAVHRNDDLVPFGPPGLDGFEEIRDRSRGSDVLACFFALAESPAAGLPAHQVGEAVADLFLDERLHHVLLDESEVNEEFAEPPALQFGSLGFEGLGEVFGDERVAGDQSGTELWTLPWHGDRVDEPAFDVDERFITGVVDDVQATCGRFGGKIEKDGFDRGSCQVAFKHWRPPTSRATVALGRP